MSLALTALVAIFVSMPDLTALQGKAPDSPPEAKRPYETAPAKPLDAKSEVVTEADDHTQYRVEFNGIKGDRVPAFLYLPKRKANTALPAILLQYGSGGNRKTDYIVAIGKQFVARGFIVLTIDSPNCGERRDKDPKTSPLGMLSAEQVMHYCGDYSRAIDYLSSRKDIDKDRIGYVGVSWGAITGITYCAYDPRIKAVGSMVGGGNFVGLWSPRIADKIAKEGSKSSDPVYHVARIAPRPLMFVNVTKDQMIWKSWAESLHKAAGPGAKVVWLETDHFFRGLDRAAICASVIDFMEMNLTARKK